MRAWAWSLADWCCLTLWGNLAELDTRIDKLRNLRDSYRESSQGTR